MQIPKVSMEIMIFPKYPVNLFNNTNINVTCKK